MPHLQPHSRGLAASSLVTAARRRARGAVAWLAAGAVSLVAAACGAAPSPTPTDPGDTPPPDVDPVRAYAQVPASPLTQIDAPGGAERAALTAAELFAEAPAVVLDDGADSRTSLRAASTAVAIGVPVLIAGTEETFAELDRLGTEVALAFGTATLPADLGAITLVAAPQDDVALASLLDVPLTDPVPMDEGHEVSSLARLSPGTLATWEWPDPAEGPGTPGPDDAEPDGEGTEPDVGEPEPDAGEPDVGEPEPDAGDPADPPITPGDAGESPGAEPGPTLPPLAETQRVDGVLALTRGTNEDLAAVATARAAGATVVVLDDPDPRATEAAVAQIAASDADHVLAIGDEWEGIDTLEWRLATAATGVQLPGGGQLVLPDKHYVALYGNPVTSVLGVLGEQDTAATIERASRYAAEYDDLLPGTVIPALEIIATVASASAGSDGNYSTEMAPETLAPLIDAAAEAGQYVVLDLQPGRSSFVEQAQLYEEFLRQPHVGLALDPEWNLGLDERHLVRVGSVSAEEVNDVIDWLADLTREEALPQKLLVLHQFQLAMIDGIDEIDLSRSELAVLIHADGQGSQPDKQATWRALHRNAPHFPWWGWKNFYDEDHPMLTPAETVEQVDPLPDFISYQ